MKFIMTIISILYGINAIFSMVPITDVGANYVQKLLKSDKINIFRFSENVLLLMLLNAITLLIFTIFALINVKLYYILGINGFTGIMCILNILLLIQWDRYVITHHYNYMTTIAEHIFK